MENRLGWTLAACARIMRPVVRLALAMGVQHSHLESVLRDLLLDEARRSWRNAGTEPNISQLSVTTGLSRKAVTARVREPSDTLPHTETSAAAKTLTLWLQMLADNPERRLLPVVAEGGDLSFEAMARQASRGNVHHRAILDELVRLQMATERDGRAELKATGFVPVGDLQAMLAFLGDNARDHVLAGVSNSSATSRACWSARCLPRGWMRRPATASSNCFANAGTRFTTNWRRCWLKRSMRRRAMARPACAWASTVTSRTARRCRASPLHPIR